MAVVMVMMMAGGNADEDALAILMDGVGPSPREGISPAADERQERLILGVLVDDAQQHDIAREQLQQLLCDGRHARDEATARVERHHAYAEALALTELHDAHRLRQHVPLRRRETSLAKLGDGDLRRGSDGGRCWATPRPGGRSATPSAWDGAMQACEQPISMSHARAYASRGVVPAYESAPVSAPERSGVEV